jgi:hypothetical protein
MQKENNINIDVVFAEGTDAYLTKEELISLYCKTYKRIVDLYENYFRQGTGIKTNHYHEPTMNLAYNYIEHDNYKKIANESPKGYTKGGSYIGRPIAYIYYQSVWSITCDQIVANYQMKFMLKFDHRFKDRKNDDFNGTLFCFKTKNYWKSKNLPNNQRY